jgi:translation initiation factor 2 alpha subunit (eIF-2alpha)
MTIVEKMYLIQKLMDEVENATRVVSKELPDNYGALYRMLTEGCADNLKVMSKNYASHIETWEKQLQYAYELINKQNN